MVADVRRMDDDGMPGTDVLAFDDYRHAVAEAVVALDVRTELDPDAFGGRVGSSVAGDVHVLRIAADAHAVHRTASLIARAPQRYVKFSLVERGHGLIAQDGRETPLAPGDLTIYDTDRPYSLVFDDDVRMSILMFPPAALELPAPQIDRLTATRLDRSPGIGDVVRPCLTALARRAGDWDVRVARSLLRSTVEMIGTLLTAELEHADPLGAHDALLRDITDHIDAHLDDPELSPGRIAAAHFISVRHLHTLFSDQGTTVSTVIRTRRLERCYDALVDPRHTDRSIAAIALANGFVDAAHFSRTFRAHFGVTPRAVRSSP